MTSAFDLADVPMWLAIVGCLILSVRYHRHWKRVEREEAARERLREAIRNMR